MRNLLWSAVFMMLLVSGCGWNGTPTRSNDYTPLTSIAISADYSTTTIANGTSVKLTVMGNFSGLFTHDVTDQVVWTSDTPTVAGFVTAAVPSRVSGIAPGTAILTATVRGISATYKLTVSDATVTKLTITTVDPVTHTAVDPSIAKGLTTQCVATGTLSDLKTQVLTDDVIWVSSATGVATVSDAAASKGLVQTIAIGTSTITATFPSNGVIGSTVMTVIEPVLQSIALSPANPSILTLSTKPFTATGTYSDGATRYITAKVTWNSTNTGIATITGAGTVTTLTQGTTTISAALGSVSQSTTLKATGGNLKYITVTPSTQTLVKNAALATTGRISASGTFSNGSIRDITGAVTWSTANTSLATVTTAGGNLAWLNPLAVTSGTAITATSGSLTGTSNLTVIAPQLKSIAFSTTSLDLTAGTGSPLIVNATFNDNTIQDVTTLSTWTSNDTAIATVAAGGLGTERVTGVAAGTTTISATYGDKTAPTAAVTVRARTLQSLTIAPATSTVAAGNRVSFTATATYGDGTTVDVTKDAIWSWSIDTPNVAILADSVNQPGEVVGVDNGTATLKASFPGTGGKSATATITVAGS